MDPAPIRAPVGQRHGSVSLLLLIGAFICLGVSAQESPMPSSASVNPQPKLRCRTIRIDSQSIALPEVFIAPALAERLQDSELTIVGARETADVVVTVEPDEEDKLKVAVTDLHNGNRQSFVTVWARYPGMVAAEVVPALSKVCPGQVRNISRPSSDSPSVLMVAGNASTITACSHTTWMDNRQIDEALLSNPQFLELGLQLLPACSNADIRIEINHNIDLTVEWMWRASSSTGGSVAGRVTAFEPSDAAARIAEAVASHLGTPRAMAQGIAKFVTVAAFPHAVSANRIVSDFLPADTKIDLFFDGERFTAVDRNGKTVFSFLGDEVLDVRLRRTWNHLFVIDAPDSDFTAMVAADLPGAAVAGAAMYIGMMTFAGILATPKVPVSIIDVAWDAGDGIQLQSFEVSNRHAGAVWQALHQSISPLRSHPRPATKP